MTFSDSDDDKVTTGVATGSESRLKELSKKDDDLPSLNMKKKNGGKDKSSKKTALSAVFEEVRKFYNDTAGADSVIDETMPRKQPCWLFARVSVEILMMVK